MQQTRYRNFFSHKVLHHDFIEKLKDMNTKTIDENQDEFIMNLLGFVSGWIINHFMHEDKMINSK